MVDVPTLFDQALSLPADQREELVVQLLLSLGDETHKPLSKSEFEALIKERVREVESGEAETVDAFEALDDVRNRLRQLAR